MTGIIFLGICTITIIAGQIIGLIIEIQIRREDAEELAKIPIQLTIWDFLEEQVRVILTFFSSFD